MEMLLLEVELLGLKIPASKNNTSEQMMEKWKKSVLHFMENHVKENNIKHIIEYLVILNVNKDNYFQGYVDRIDLHKDSDGNKYIDIVDWKTSSKSSFSKQKRIEAGRQLLIYAMAVEEAIRIPVKGVYWNMLKYCDLHYEVPLKSGKISKKKYTGVDRCDIASKKLEVLSKEMDDTEYAMCTLEFNPVEENWDVFGKAYTDLNFYTKDYIIEHPLTDETKRECVNRILSTLREIEEHGTDEENFNEFKLNPHSTDGDYFCTNLCGVKKSCPVYRTWKNMYGNKNNSEV